MTRTKQHALERDTVILYSKKIGSLVSSIKVLAYDTTAVDSFYLIGLS